MSKKTATIIISVLILLVTGGLLAFYFYTNRAQDTGTIGGDTRGNIFPGGETGSTGTGGTQGGEISTPPSAGEQPTQGLGQPRALVLKELSTRPIAGAVATATSSLTLVRFIEKGTGNVYEVNPETDGENRLSNTTVPKIEEAVWNKNGTQVITRYADDDGDSIKTYSAKLISKSASDTEGSLQGEFLTDNIRAVVTNPDKSKIFYLLNSSSGSIGIISDFNGGKKTQIFDSPLQEWLIDWPNESLITLNTKPSAGVAGYLFLLNAKTGKLTRAISAVNGLITLIDPLGNLALYSESASQKLSLKIYSFKAGTTVEVPITTLPEKCIWSKNNLGIIYCAVPSYIQDGNYPDIWYQGQTQFSDEIWQIDSKNGASKLLTALKDLSNKDIDSTSLFMSPDEKYLFFTNKSDFHLWSLRL